MKKLELKRKYPVFFEEALASTNDTLKAMSANAEEGSALIAAYQSAGKGRLSRSFLSPKGGLYMSVLCRPVTAGELVPQLTAAAAVAVRRAIEKECGIECKIKWPNDLVFNGRKLCGILTEAVWRGERADIIVGIGVNVNAETFPEELRDKACSVKQLTGRETDIFSLAESILSELDRETEAWQKDSRAQLEEYRAHCITAGCKISAEGRTGTALGIGDDYSLAVHFDDGGTEALRFGEVSVGGIYGFA